MSPCISGVFTFIVFILLIEMITIAALMSNIDMISHFIYVLVFNVKLPLNFMLTVCEQFCFSDDTF